MKVRFEKWHGCQNDFILVWTSANEEKYLLLSLKAKARDICTGNGSGIGADGIIVLTFDEQRSGLLKVRIINSDGSLADNCGNGLRCAAASYFHRQEKAHVLAELGIIELEVSGVAYRAELLSAPGDDKFFVSVDMGAVVHGEDLDWFADAREEISLLKLENVPQGLLSHVDGCKIGNEHLVFISNAEAKELDEALDLVGPAIQRLQYWDGINVHLATESSLSAAEMGRVQQLLGSPVGDCLIAFSWERGVGRTLACGSGACAVASSWLAEGFTNRDEWVVVSMPGGPLFLKQSEPDGPVILAGDAREVFCGSFDL